jgi:hypothetical protein
MINIDLTTKNTVYNTLGPQAQWVQHRFGRRDYPDIELAAETVKQVISQSSDTVNFISVFGDPSEHTDIIEIVNHLDQGKLVFNSYLNFNNDNLIEALNSNQAYIVVPCYGIYELANKVVLNSNWSQIESNLKKLNCTICVEFYIFEHNVHQLPQLETLCKALSIELKLKPGTAFHPDGFSPIVDDNGRWLYDVYSCDKDTKTVKWPNLHQTVNGYNSLIQFIKPVIGDSILKFGKFYKIDSSVTTDNISISATGHVFPSFELHQIFSNSLCTDWNFSFSNITEFNKISINPEYAHLCSAITNISKMLEFNSLSTNQYSDILENFTNSNV